MSIKLVSRRGAIGKGWHAVALRDAAERLLGVGRSGSGRADARAGRVQWLDVEAGIARGDVLDADGELYQARLDLPVYSPSDREVFLQVVRARPGAARPARRRRVPAGDRGRAGPARDLAAAARRLRAEPRLLLPGLARDPAATSRPWCTCWSKPWTSTLCTW